MHFPTLIPVSVDEKDPHFQNWCSTFSKTGGWFPKVSHSPRVLALFIINELQAYDLLFYLNYNYYYHEDFEEIMTG